MSDDRTFVSYSRADSQFAVKLASDLRGRGAAVWVDQLDIPAGARWDSAVEEALRRATRVVVLLSPTAVVSQNVLDEVSFALDEGKAIVPVLVESCTIPLRLRRLQYVDFSAGYAPALTRLLATLGVVHAASPPPPARPAQEPRTPVVDEPPIFAPPAAPASPRGGRGIRLAIAAGGAGVVLLLAFVLAKPNRPTDRPTDPPADSSGTTVESASRANEPARAPTTPAAEPAPTRLAPKSGAGLQTLQALTRELSTQSALSPGDLERLANAELNACQGEAPSSSCATAATSAVSTMFDAVCARRLGPAPPADADKILALKYESDTLLCKQPYTDLWLKRMDENARGSIRRIKPG